MKQAKYSMLFITIILTPLIFSSLSCQDNRQSSSGSSSEIDGTILFDGTFAQTKLQTILLMDKLPETKDEFLDLWYLVNQNERNELISAIENEFSLGIVSISCYFSSEDRFVFSLNQNDPGTYYANINEETEQWIISRDELIG